MQLVLPAHRGVSPALSGLAIDPELLHVCFDGDVHQLLSRLVHLVLELAAVDILLCGFPRWK